MSKEVYNVIIMGIGFLLLFTAFQTIQNIEKALFNSLKAEDPKFTGDAYVSLAVVYTAFALANWLAPSFISLTGPRAAIVIGSFLYTIYMLGLLQLTTWLLYVISVLIGVGAAILWIGQGVLLTRCSNDQTISRNMGIFWMFYQSSQFFGNIFVFCTLHEKKSIDRSSRITIIAVLAGIVGLSNIILLTLRRIPDVHADLTPRKPLKAAWLALQSAAYLFITHDMLLLNILFIYSGFSLTFIGGVYANAVGFTQKMASTPKEIIALAGFCFGIGEIFGGVIYGMLATKLERFFIDPFIISSYVCFMLAYILTWLNLPNESTFSETDAISIFNPPRIWLALLCAILMGLADACYHVQIYTILGTYYAPQSAEAFAIFTFTQSIATAGGFLYSYYIGLMWQLIILLICCTLATFCLYLVKWRQKKHNYQSKQIKNQIENQ